MAANRPQDDRNQEATVYMGNLDERCTDAIIWELMLQAGPVANVHLPKDRVNMAHQGYGFCEFLSEEDAEYACKIMNQIKIYGKPIRVNKASSDKKQIDIGANLFIGNLDLNVDERHLFDTFMSFGTLVAPAKISRDSNGISKGFGFVSFDSFESSDAAIEAMNNQYLMNKPVTVGYAFKKDGKGERHGTAVERHLAAEARKNMVVMPGMASQMGLLGGPPVSAPPMGQPMGQPMGMAPPSMPMGGPGYGMPPPPPMGFGAPPPPPVGFR